MPRRAIAAVKRRDPLARLGLLICVAMLAGIGLCGRLWWNATNAPRVHLTLFFRNSVHGIDIGSPVKIHGVQVGQIEMMGVRLPTETDPDHYAMVKVALDGDLLKEKGLPENLDHAEPLHREIGRGLRGRMQLISPITGDLYLELEYKPDTKALIVSDKTEEIAELPTLSDPLSEGIVNLTHKFSDLEKRDFARIESELNAKLDAIADDLAPQRFADLNAATVAGLDNLRSGLESTELRTRLAKINTTLVELRAAIAKIDTGSDRGVADATRLMQSLRTDLAAASAEAEKITRAADPRSPALLLASARLARTAMRASEVRRLCAEIVSANAPLAELLLNTRVTEADAPPKEPKALPEDPVH